MRKYNDPIIQCAKCRNQLPPEFGEMPRLACPNCGSIRRKFTMSAGGGEMKLTGGVVSMVHTRPGVNSTAKADDQGRISLEVTGSSPKNEDDALEICSRLVRVLNSKGENWTVPISGHQDVDGYSSSPTNDELRMQVVRASNKPELWKELTQNGTAISESEAPEVARDLIATVLKKSIRYPEVQKKALTLVLDAARTPIYTFQRVLDEFRINHLGACQNAGFEQVWIVGPQDSIVARIDI